MNGFTFQSPFVVSKQEEGHSGERHSAGRVCRVASAQNERCRIG